MSERSYRRVTRLSAVAVAVVTASLSAVLGSACVQAIQPAQGASSRKIARWCASAVPNVAIFAANMPPASQDAIDQCSDRYQRFASPEALDRLRCQAEAADADEWRACHSAAPRGGTAVTLQVAGVAEDAGILGALRSDSELTGGIGGLIGARGTQLGARGTQPNPGLGSVRGDPIILGALDKSLIDVVIKKNIRAIRECYAAELVNTPNLSGKVVVKFVIAADGSVSRASTKSSTLDRPSVEGCINEQFMRFQFPEPSGGGIVIVSYPFLFSPG